MKFKELEIKGVFLISLEKREDHRGFFCRTFCEKEFAEYDLDFPMVQSNLSFSKKKNTLRGMHFQKGDAAEAKLIRCLSGKILDVVVDLRKDSPTFCKYVSVELTANNDKMLYVPRGFAHGFLTLEDDSTIFYQVSNFYSPENEGGVRWNDEAFGINWPVQQPIISDKDKAHPDFLISINK